MAIAAPMNSVASKRVAVGANKPGTDINQGVPMSARMKGATIPEMETAAAFAMLCLKWSVRKPRPTRNM